MSEKNDRTLVLKILNLLESFIFQIVDNELFHSLFVHFLAVLKIDEQMSWLQTADNYLFMLIKMIYCVQMLRVKILMLFNQQKHQGEMK